jgi:hypothetical protein
MAKRLRSHFARLLDYPAVVENERYLKHTLGIGSYFDNKVSPFIHRQEISG